jgi:hypothetical protein
MNGQTFIVGLANPKRSQMEVQVTMPAMLTKLGWKIKLSTPISFLLASGEKKEIELCVTAGKEFTATDVSKSRDRDVRIDVLADGIPIGAMTYALDPKMKKAAK